MSQTTLLYFDPIFLRHQPGSHHPESPERLERIMELYGRVPVTGVDLRAPRPASAEELACVHTPALISALGAQAGQRARIDADTAMSPHSYQAALMAAGAAVAAVGEVIKGQAKNAFAMVRPPGHHAE